MTPWALYGSLVGGPLALLGLEPSTQHLYPLHAVKWGITDYHANSAATAAFLQAVCAAVWDWPAHQGRAHCHLAPLPAAAPNRHGCTAASRGAAGRRRGRCRHGPVAQHVSLWLVFSCFEVQCGNESQNRGASSLLPHSLAISCVLLSVLALSIHTAFKSPQIQHATWLLVKQQLLCVANV